MGAESKDPENVSRHDTVKRRSLEKSLTIPLLSTYPRGSFDIHLRTGSSTRHRPARRDSGSLRMTAGEGIAYANNLFLHWVHFSVLPTTREISANCFSPPSAKSLTKTPTSVSSEGDKSRGRWKAIGRFCSRGKTESPRSQDAAEYSGAILSTHRQAIKPVLRSRDPRLRAEHRVSAEGEECLHGFAVQLLRFAQRIGEFIQSTQRIQPGVAQHRRVAEKTLLDGAGQHFQRHGFFTQVGELTRHIEQALGVAKRGLAELFTGLQTLFAPAFEQRPQRRQVQSSQSSRLVVLFFPKPGDGLLRAPQCCKDQGRTITEVAAARVERPLIVSQHEVSVRHGGGNLRIEAARLLMRRHRRLKQTAVAAHMGQTGEEFGIISPPLRAFQQSLHRVQRPPLIDLEVGIEIVRQGQIGIQPERRLEGVVSRLKAFLRPKVVFVPEPAGPSQARPGGCIGASERFVELHG